MTMSELVIVIEALATGWLNRFSVPVSSIEKLPSARSTYPETVSVSLSRKLVRVPLNEVTDPSK